MFWFYIIVPIMQSRVGKLKVLLYTDAGSRGNPGPSAYAFIISIDGKVSKEQAQFIGKSTNNEAEYKALIAGLDEVLRLGADEVEIYSDSELMVKQLNGQYRIKASNILPLANEVRSRMGRFEKASISHLSREHPMIIRADALHNRELDDMELAAKLRK